METLFDLYRLGTGTRATLIGVAFLPLFVFLMTGFFNPNLLKVVRSCFTLFPMLYILRHGKFHRAAVLL